MLKIESTRLSATPAALVVALLVAFHLDICVVGVSAALRVAQSPAETGTVETKVVRPGIEHGLGAEHRPSLVKAQGLIQANRIAEAERLLEEIVEAIDTKIRAIDRVHVTVASRAELERFAAERGGVSKVEWVDWVYREAIQTQAYIAAGRGDLERALTLLGQAEALAPYEPAPLIEKGFVLNKLGRSKEALESYRRAHDLTERFESARPVAPMALRGIGFSLIELGDLKGAREAFEESLRLEPNNPTALHELDYIRSLETKSP